MFVEVCKVDDKNHEYYINANKAAGHEVLRGRLYPQNKQEFYYVILSMNEPHRSPFKPMKDGLYTLVRDDAGKYKTVYHG